MVAGGAGIARGDGGGHAALRTAGMASAALLAAALAVMPVLKVHSLHASFFDLGQYASLAWRVAQGERAAVLFQVHAHPFLLPYGLLYGLFPTPVTLMVVQSLGLIVGALLFALYWRRRGLPHGEWAAVLALLALAVWYNTLFDFHFEHLLLPLFALLALALESPRKWAPPAALLAALAICGVKEMYALTAAAAGLAALVRPGRRWVGAAIVAVSLSYFAAMTMVVIPAYTSGQGTGEIWTGAFGHLGASTDEILGQLARRPWLLAQEAFSTWRKPFYAAVLFGSLLFVPLLAPLALLPALPVLALVLLSHNDNHVGLGHQYTAGITVPLLFALAAALTRPALAVRRDAVLALVLLSSLAVLAVFGPSPLSRFFWSGKLWFYTASAYVPTARDAELRALLDRLIPAEAAVAVQNPLVTAALVNRAAVFAFPEAVFAPVSFRRAEGERPVLAEYVALDLQRPWFLGDRGCDWAWGACRDSAAAQSFRAAVARLSEDFAPLHDRDGILILRRKSQQQGQP